MDNAIFRQYSIALLIHFVMLVVRIQIWSRAVINVWFVQGRNMNMVKVVDVAERQVEHKATVIIEEIGHSGARFQPQYSEAEADTRVWVPWRPELHSETLSQEKGGVGGRDLAFYTGTIEITSREENSIYSKFILKGKSLAGGGEGGNLEKVEPPGHAASSGNSQGWARKRTKAAPDETLDARLHTERAELGAFHVALSLPACRTQAWWGQRDLRWGSRKSLRSADI